MDLKKRSGEDIRIIDDDIDDYNTNDDYDKRATKTFPIKYIVELKETATDQIYDVIKSSVNATATTSIYDFQGEVQTACCVGLFNQGNSIVHQCFPVTVRLFTLISNTNHNETYDFEM